MPAVEREAGTSFRLPAHVRDVESAVPSSLLT
jgi:hypothetical protein